MSRKIQTEDLQKFLDYAALFLSNIGNYFVRLRRPKVRAWNASGYPAAGELLNRVMEPMFQLPPNSLGHPGPFTQTRYCLGADCLASSEDVASISKLMEDLSIHPENTRLRRYRASGRDSYDILQASVVESKFICNTGDELSTNGKRIQLIRGDHKDELEQICQSLRQSINYASNPAQQLLLRKTMDSFLVGDLELYKNAQKIWVTDKAPSVETVIGFIEPYRDPLGIRAEFEGIVGIPDPTATETLRKLASVADKFVFKLPWVEGNGGRKGPFEKELFDPPDFSSVQSLAYCSSIIFQGINLPNTGDRLQDIIFSNRMAAERIRPRGLHMVNEAERETFRSHRFHSYYIWVVLHAILGHGTGKFLTEISKGNYNFDLTNPPLNPLTGNPVSCWYHLGQTWTGVFGDLATTVDECRADLVGAYLIDEPGILTLFGYTDQSEIKCRDLVYNLYLQLGIDGLRGLENYDPITEHRGQAHSRAHFAIFRYLLRNSDGLYTVLCDPVNQKLTLNVDRSNTIQKGKPCLGRMLLTLHIYRGTADISHCREFYEDLSHVDAQALQWRDIILFHKEPPLAFCHANTFLDGYQVRLKEYEPTAQGVIQSWAEREI
ncbi:hypothetical protein ARAM_000118 [Aspergillus rambellii]|uniref:Dipeptidyl peptidase III n=1 Tax=Aspergillus rambellii TaxID=308745 RepID=A0A0F8VNX8_9EURO|nr:hypothetical protein ARAM_000118 [Aspergillus rambellii]